MKNEQTHVLATKTTFIGSKLSGPVVDWALKLLVRDTWHNFFLCSTAYSAQSTVTDCGDLLSRQYLKNRIIDWCQIRKKISIHNRYFCCKILILHVPYFLRYLISKWSLSKTNGHLTLNGGGIRNLPFLGSFCDYGKLLH